MTQYIDMHIHSSCSDGTFSPREIVLLAKRDGVNSIAIADHDTVSAVEEALLAGATLDVEVIPAVELSVDYKHYDDLHILGYFIDIKNREFSEKLDSLALKRGERVKKILINVNDKLVREKKEALKIEDVYIHVQEVVGRPHIADALIKKGYVENVEQAFREFLIPCNVPKSTWSPKEAIDLIHKASGIAVLAHPTSLCTDYFELSKIISELKGFGLDGIEVFNNAADTLQMEFLENFALQNSLLVTAGSDFHGRYEQKIGTGRNGMTFPYKILETIKQEINRRSN